MLRKKRINAVRIEEIKEILGEEMYIEIQDSLVNKVLSSVKARPLDKEVNIFIKEYLDNCPEEYKDVTTLDLAVRKLQNLDSYKNICSSTCKYHLVSLILEYEYELQCQPTLKGLVIYL